MQKKAKMSLEKRHNLTGWAFLIPAALLIFIFCFYPMVQALILSFSKKGTGGSTFVGLANYQRILKDKTFQQCLFNTVFYFIIQVPVMLVLALGNVLNAGFDQIFNLYSPIVYQTGDIIDTYVYRLGIQQAQYSVGAAIGLFKSAVSAVLVLTSYILADKCAGYKIF